MALYKHGFRNIILPVGYRGDMIRAYVQDHELSRHNVQFHCVETGLDTSIAGRIQQVRHLIPEHGDFFLINSDTIFDFDVGRMHRLHKEKGALVTLSSVEVVPSWGIILVDGEELVGFDRKRRVHQFQYAGTGATGVVNSGLAWLNKDALDTVELESVVEFETELYQHVISLGKAAHFRLEGIWFPIDTPKDLNVINMGKGGSGGLAQSVRDEFALFEAVAG